MNFECANFKLNENEPPIAIAEIGVNHNCDMLIARKLVDEAQKAGAHVVKFQAFVSEEEISKYADKAEYQKDTTGSHGTQLEMAKALELTHSQLREIRDYCYAKQMPFLCSAFESLSFNFLVKDLKVKTVKIASSEVTNHPFLKEIASSGVSAILSTGASTLDEVAAAINVMKQAGIHELALMHCVSNYPAELSQANLLAIQTMRKAFNLSVGYSDHTLGIEAPMIACALGATMIEKHFTLDCKMQGPDHRASIEPKELAMMVKSMNLAYLAKGDGIKRVVECEKKNRQLIRKSIIARTDLPAGHILSETDLGAKRPLGGIEPPFWDHVLGKKLLVAVSADQALRWEDLEK